MGKCSKRVEASLFWAIRKGLVEELTFRYVDLQGLVRLTFGDLGSENMLKAEQKARVTVWRWDRKDT